MFTLVTSERIAGSVSGYRLTVPLLSLRCLIGVKMMPSPRLLVALLLLLVASSCAKFQEFDDGDDVAEYDDNDFAEFEDTADEATTPHLPHQQHPQDEEEEDDDEEATVELEGQEEFELDTDGQEGDNDNEPYDDEEFEGYEDKIDSGNTIKSKDPITIVDVPAHLQNSWESYYMEILMVTGLLAYIMNYIIGKNKNSRLAHAWFNSHRELLESNFSLVGDDGTSKDAVSTGKLNQENEHIYNLWCSGRLCCEGMLIQLKFLKRQDLLNVLARMMRPTCDQVQIKVTMNEEDMDTYVFAVGTRKTLARLQKEMQDLSEFCSDKPKSAAKLGLPESLAILSEMGEVTDGVLDTKIIHYLTHYADKIESIHFSDQFSGPKVMQEMVTRVNIGLLSAALRLVTRCLPWLPVKTSLNRCHTRQFSDVCGESSDKIKFWTFFPDQRQHSRGLIAAACYTGRYR
ncbi:unnamed protein product [Ranitomeya imitator]|uniref:PAT complex subunit CCDC47 n=1 Tax=Ranitomeya imitator TaxID=111125 RepID=A0ABN9KXD9_9NEOB|nr:unnamed protein product [Ranitomeya imitator]